MTLAQAQRLDWFSILGCSDSLMDHDAVTRIHRGAAMQLLLGETQPRGFAYNLAASVASQVTRLSLQ